MSFKRCQRSTNYRPKIFQWQRGTLLNLLSLYRRRWINIWALHLDEVLKAYNSNRRKPIAFSTDLLETDYQEYILITYIYHEFVTLELNSHQNNEKDNLQKQQDVNFFA